MVLADLHNGTTYSTDWTDLQLNKTILLLLGIVLLMSDYPKFKPTAKTGLPEACDVRQQLVTTF